MPTLSWNKREEAVRAATRAPYRLLEPVAELSHGDADSENLLIHGDNLDALKALLPYYAGRVKCIAIDPPYNTQSAFQHYDDNLEHSIWLSTMYPRLEILRDLLTEDGSIWVCIDDNEGHYLKVVLDEVFGRKNFIATIIWQKKYTQANDAEFFSDNHDFVIVMAKNRDHFRLNGIPRDERQDKAYRNPDSDPSGRWKATPLHAKSGTNTDFKFRFKNGVVWSPPAGTFPRFSEATLRKMDENDEIWFGKAGNATPSRKTFLSSVNQTIVPKTIWLFDEVGHNHEARTEAKAFCPQDPFGTPKPERLIQRVLTLSTNPGDLVLDSFLGSGTTAAVAHKMGRRWIGIELGEHAVTHCAPRLKKVVEGEQGGISQAVGWKGGGGFRFCRLGPPIFDENDHINKSIQFPVLAAHVWFSETHTPLVKAGKSPLLGVHKDAAYYLLFNGILGDTRPGGGNVLTGKLLAKLPRHDGPKVIYGECTSLGEERLRREGVVFKQIPYDVKRR